MSRCKPRPDRVLVQLPFVQAILVVEDDADLRHLVAVV